MTQFAFILIGWILAQIGFIYSQNRIFIKTKLEALKLLKIEIHMNSVAEHTDSEKKSTLTFSQQAYNSVVNLLGFLDSSLLENILIHHASINEYKQNKELFRAAMVELFMNPIKLKALKEKYVIIRDEGEAKIKSSAEKCIPELENAIDSLLKKKYYFLAQMYLNNNGEKIMDTNNLLKIDKIKLDGRIYPAIRSCVNNRYKIIVSIFAYYSFIFSSETFCQITNQNFIRIGSTIFFLIIVLINSFNYWENAKEQITIENKYEDEKKSLKFFKIMNIEIPFSSIVSVMLILAYFFLNPNCSNDSIGTIINIQNAQELDTK